MNVKKQILSALLLLAALTVSAQEPQGETVYDFKPHWFLQVQPVGGQYARAAVLRLAAASNEALPGIHLLPANIEGNNRYRHGV